LTLVQEGVLKFVIKADDDRRHNLKHSYGLRA
jgi:hypothetical protein